MIPGHSNGKEFVAFDCFGKSISGWDVIEGVSVLGCCFSGIEFGFFSSIRNLPFFLTDKLLPTPSLQRYNSGLGI